MRIRILPCAVIAAAVLFPGCGKQERLEAVHFAKTLSAKQSTVAAADNNEKEFVANARIWCSSVTGSGAGRGEALDQNAAVAGELAKSALATSAGLSDIRQAIEAEPLHEEYARGVRNALMTQLQRRQRMLQDVRAVLQDAETQFRRYRLVKSFTGETYPDGVTKLDAILASYRPPDDAVGSALSALTSKYAFKQGEI